MRFAALRERLVELVLRVPVSLKVMGIALGLTLLLGGTLLWQIHNSWHGLLLGELEERGKLLGANLAAHIAEDVVARNTDQLGSLLEDTRARLPEVDYLLVLDHRGEVLAGTRAGGAPAQLLAANRLGLRGEPRVALLDTERGPIRDVAVPILDGQAGVVRVGMSERFISSEVGWLTQRLAVGTAVVAALGVLAALFLTAVLTQPIREMAGLANAVQKQDFGKRAVVRAGDELGRLAIAFNEMAEALGRKEKARQELLRQLIAAAEDERKRVARELHDGTGQSLTSLVAGLSALEVEGGDDAPRRARLAELRELAARTLGEVHDISRALRPAILDDLGLMAAVGKHCEMFSRRFDLTVDCQGVGFEQGPRLSPEIELAAYRIVQEALTNAVRHGRAAFASVLVQRKDAALLLVIEDEGHGFVATDWRQRSVAGGHLGLLGIEERAALLGGSLRVESSPGSGTSLFVEIPVSREADDV